MRELTVSQALNEAIKDEMRRDKKVWCMGEDIGPLNGVYKVTKGLLDEFGPDRVRDTPISEGAIAGCAVGSAMGGYRPIAEFMYCDFIASGSAMDQVINQAAKIIFMSGGQAKLPLVYRTTIGGGTAHAAQHSQSLEAMFMGVPGLKLIAPSCARDAYGLMKSAIRDDNPVMCFEHKVLYFHKFNDVPDDTDFTIPIGKADIKREGKDITIVAYSIMVAKALEAASELEKEGIDVEVVDIRSIEPLDIDTILKSVKKTGKVIITHEAPERCGVGAEIFSQIGENAFDYLDTPIARVCGKNVSVAYHIDLDNYAMPQKEDVIKAARKVME